MPFPLKPYLSRTRADVDSALRKVFARREGCPAVLWKSMKYSVFAGGKRLRPILCLASAEAVGLPSREAMRLACSLELIHTYSLIHDDLPALDDDDERRGRRTNHKVFGEAMAILAGDGLLTLAFQWISDPSGYGPRFRKNLAAAVYELARRAGYPGMVGGQVDDLAAEKQKPNLPRVLSIHRRKTGALLLSSVLLPGILAGARGSRLRALRDYGAAAGLAFQVVDDILNETGDSRKMGKKAGSDRERGKMTYPAVLGLERSKGEVERLTRSARLALKPLGPGAEPLAELAAYMAGRTH
jgi:geranylgeranyl diphosphate synthase, type II